jgi:hypothetical protein
MPSHQEYTGMLQKITTYIDAIQIELQEQIEGQTDSGQPVSGYSCRYGSHQIEVVGCPTWEFFQVRYSFDLAQLLAVQQADVEPSQGTVTIDRTDIRSARDDLAGRLSDEEHAALRLELITQLSDSSNAIALDADESDRVFGLTATRNIFVYEDAFGLGEFHEAVQRTVNLGWRGKEILIDAYGIRDELEIPESVANTLDDDVGPSAFR